jgi:hypothetical protein
MCCERNVVKRGLGRCVLASVLFVCALFEPRERILLMLSHRSANLIISSNAFQTFTAKHCLCSYVCKQYFLFELS